MATRRPTRKPRNSTNRKSKRRDGPVARAKASATFMAGVRESLEARRRGIPGTPFEELKRKIASE